MGYAFVNFDSEETAQRFKEHFHGFARWGADSECSDKICDTSAAGLKRGLSTLIECYRNSRVMHKSVADEFKPAIFSNGMRVPFPEPTKKILNPRVSAEKTSSSQ